jgi:hypothetical protein
MCPKGANGFCSVPPKQQRAMPLLLGVLLKYAKVTAFTRWRREKRPWTQALCAGRTAYVEIT